MKVDDSAMNWAGCIQVLCKCSGQVDKETRERIDNAVADWCKETGWTMEPTTAGIDIFPPSNT